MKPKPILTDLLVIVVLFGVLSLVSWFSGGKQAKEEAVPPEVAVEAPAMEQREVESAEISYGSYEVDIPEGYTLAGIPLRANGEEVINVLGQPVRKERHSEDGYPNDGKYTLWVETWIYDGMEITFTDSVPSTDPEPTGPGTVDCISVTGGDYQTKDGVKVGDSFERLKELNPSATNRNGAVSRTLVFTLTGGKVSEIKLVAFSVE